MNFKRLVLGGIEAKVCKQIVNTRWKALDKIDTIYMLLHHSAKTNQQTFVYSFVFSEFFKNTFLNFKIIFQ